MTDEKCANRVRRITGQLRELAAITKSINWRMDHGHIVGDTPCFKNNGEPALMSNGRQALLEHDIACTPSGSDHVVRRAASYGSERVALRFMVAAQPKTILQLIEDYEALLAEKDEQIAALTSQPTEGDRAA